MMLSSQMNWTTPHQSPAVQLQKALREVWRGALGTASGDTQTSNGLCPLAVSVVQLQHR